MLTIGLGAIPATMPTYLGFLGLPFSLGSISTTLLMLLAVALGELDPIRLR